MILGLVAAVGAAGCYGFASIFQATAADRQGAHGGSGLASLVQVLSHWHYLGGLGLNLLGFLAAFAALQTLPLFVVQAAVAGSVAVTAVAAHFILGVGLRRRDWGALGVVMAGLVLLATAGRPADATPLEAPGPLLVLGAAVVVALVAGVLASTAKPHGAVLAFLAGASFAGVSISARALEIPDHLTDVVRDPLVYALGTFGVLGIVVYAAALQRSPVISVATITLAVQTVVPAVVGVAFLGDETRDGFVPVALVGFALTVLGSIGLARSGRGALPASALVLEGPPEHRPAPPA